MTIESGDLFSSSSAFDGPKVERIELPDADIEYWPEFIPEEVRRQIFELLISKVEWRQEKIKYFGKFIDIPRLTAWYGDSGIRYSYSGIEVHALPWLQILKRIKDRIEQIHHDELNCVLLNLYRDQRDGVAWHSDDEKELGSDPVIASVSLGEPRPFQFRHKLDKTKTYKIELEPGSLLIMRGPTQRFWQHQIPKASRALKPRINLTYRYIAEGA